MLHLLYPRKKIMKLKFSHPLSTQLKPNTMLLIYWVFHLIVLWLESNAWVEVLEEKNPEVVS